MPAMEPFYALIANDYSIFNKSEWLFLDAVLFSAVCDALLRELINEQISGLNAVSINIKEEKQMLDNKLMQKLINEILISGEYTIRGISFYTGIPEEIIDDIYIGLNTYPSGYFMRKIIEIHKSIYYEFYRSLIKKIMEKMLNRDLK